MSAAIFFTWQWGTILDLQYTYIYTKALPDRIFSSVRGSTILRVKPGLQVRIFYLFKMSSKMLISRIYIYVYIYIRNRWYFELINYGNISPNLHDFKLNYSICWIRVYIYIWFSAFSMVYFIRWRMNIKKINKIISIYSSKKETSLVSLVCWNILSVGFMYIYIGFLHPPWITVSNKEWTFNVSISEFGWSRWTSHFIYETT